MLLKFPTQHPLSHPLSQLASLTLASDSSGVPLNQLLERDAHLFLHGTRCIDMATDAEQLGAMVTLPTK